MNTALIKRSHLLHQYCAKERNYMTKGDEARGKDADTTQQGTIACAAGGVADELPGVC